MKIKAKTKKDIKFGAVDIDLNNIKPSEIKVRITTFLDSDVLEALKKEASLTGIGYQTLLNNKLREIMLGEKTVLARLEKLEKKVFGKGA